MCSHAVYMQLRKAVSICAMSSDVQAERPWASAKWSCSWRSGSSVLDMREEIHSEHLMSLRPLAPDSAYRRDLFRQQKCRRCGRCGSVAGHEAKAKYHTYVIPTTPHPDGNTPASDIFQKCGLIRAHIKSTKVATINHSSHTLLLYVTTMSSA